MIERAILQAMATQHQVVIDTLSDAFMTDPALSFIVPDESARAKMLPKLFALLVSDDAKAGTVMRSEKDEAAALWRNPGMAKDAGGTSFGLMW
ncbi:MAG: hypothetical protein WAT18_11930, partial [Sphingorhabdus sp.]